MHISTFASSKAKVFPAKSTSPTRRASLHSPAGKKLEGAIKLESNTFIFEGQFKEHGVLCTTATALLE